MKRKIGTAVLLMVSILIINVDGTYAKTSKNLLKNPGFESSDFSMWKYKGTGMDKLDYYTEDPVGIWNKKMIVIPETIHFIFGRHINIILNWNRQFQKRNLTKTRHIKHRYIYREMKWEQMQRYIYML